jgi:CheY-like chemotaxis protein
MAEKESGDSLDGAGELILVVDDEQSVREVTKQTLEAFHYTVLTASEGTEAAAIYSVHSTEISLVITDMMMPVMDGAKLVHTLRKINPSLKIIGSSGLIDKRDGNSKELGLNDFLLKPYTAEDLLICVKNVLMKK